MQKGVELWYVEVHLHHLKGVCPKMMGQYFFISRVPQATFFDAVREAAMEAIRQIGEILEARLRYTQEYLSEVHAEMMEVKLKATTMKQKIEDFKAHVAQFQWDWRILKEIFFNKVGRNAWPYQTMWVAAFVIKYFLEFGFTKNG